jgi:hypothetical protein
MYSNENFEARCPLRRTVEGMVVPLRTCLRHILNISSLSIITDADDDIGRAEAVSVIFGFFFKRKTRVEFFFVCVSAKFNKKNTRKPKKSKLKTMWSLFSSYWYGQEQEDRARQALTFTTADLETVQLNVVDKPRSANRASFHFYKLEERIIARKLELKKCVSWPKIKRAATGVPKWAQTSFK